VEGRIRKKVTTQEKVTLTALEEVRYDLLRHLKKRTDVEIIKLETTYNNTSDFVSSFLSMSNQDLSIYNT